MSGFGVPAGLAPAGVVVVADLVPVGAVVVAAGLVPPGAVVVAAAPLPVALPPFPLPCAAPVFPAGVPVAAGVDGGSDVSGVGSGGNGFDSTPAINSFMPSVLSPFRYLYHCVRLSFQPVFAAVNFASEPASATAVRATVDAG